MVENNTISDRLIVALDVPTERQALQLLAQLDGSVNFFKVGLELLSSSSGLRLIEHLADLGHKVFADFKFLDIPQTVYRAVRNLNGRGINFLTVHAEPQAMQAAVQAADDMSVLAVTVLTSVSEQSIKDMGYAATVAELVKMRALHAKQYGCAGVIASPKEANLIRESTDKEFLVVTPGIREQNSPSHDQERTMGVTEALRAGSDYVVVGRPIRDAKDPKSAALGFQSRIRDWNDSLISST